MKRRNSERPITVSGTSRNTLSRQSRQSGNAKKYRLLTWRISRYSLTQTARYTLAIRWPIQKSKVPATISGLALSRGRRRNNVETQNPDMIQKPSQVCERIQGEGCFAVPAAVTIFHL